LWLTQGEGFLYPNDAKPCTFLPPGYPVFLSMLIAMRDSTVLIVIVQFLMSLGCIALVYAAFSEFSARMAFWPCAVISASPWIAATATKIMSEGTGIFLSSVMLWLVSRLERGQFGPRLALLTGSVAVAACLTVPAVSVCMAGIWLIVLVRRLRAPWTAAALVAGAIAVVTPWQIHVYRATGAFAPALLTTLPRNYHGTFEWMRTWVYTPDDFGNGMLAYIVPNKKSDHTTIPPRAFPDASTRAQAERLANEWRSSAAGRRADDSGAAYRPLDTFLAGLAERAKSESRVRHVVLPCALRAWNLWFQPTGTTRITSDRVRGLLPAAMTSRLNDRSLEEITWVAALLLRLLFLAHLAMIAWFAWLAARLSFARRAIPIAIVAGTIVYTVLTAMIGGVEVRRNLPFIPLLLILAYYSARRRALSLDAR